MIRNWNALFLGFALLLPSTSQAINLLNPSANIPDTVANAAIKTFGIYMSHRPYQGATSIFGESALEVNVELTVMHLGSGLTDAMTANGLGSTQSTSIPLPIAKIHIRKAISKTVDMGISGIFYNGQEAIGGDLKIVLSEPEEGLATAIRLGYSYGKASILYLKDVHVYSPEFIVSRKLDQTEPYLGVGGRFMAGTISLPFNIPPIPAGTVVKSGTGLTAYAFTGVRFKILGPKGFIFGLEGAYDMSGFSSLGTLFGIAF